MAKKEKKAKKNDGSKQGDQKMSHHIPTDTNFELLPGKITVALSELTQAPPEQRRITGKKRKRLDKYIENKLKKEEAAAVLKKLAERVVDTSALQSTKTLGQAKQRRLDANKLLPNQSENVGKVEEETEKLNETDADHEGSPTLNFFVVGSSSSSNRPSSALASALKKADLTTGADSKTKKRKRPAKMSWRERLEISKKKRMDDETSSLSEISDVHREEEEDDDGELSEWNGFSDEASGEDITDQETYLNGEKEQPVVVARHPSGSASDSEEEDNRSRALNFKNWAREQSGFGPSVSNLSSLPKIPPGTTTRPSNTDVPNEEKETPEEQKPERRKPAYFVPVGRSISIQEMRLSLPIIAEEQHIMETLGEHDCVIVCGETGSGKTTQIPQFLFEAGYGSEARPGMIGVTQPRRVAAVSMAARVAEELGDAHKGRVGYQIRFDAKVTPETSIKFMTDGVLLREVAVDFLLQNYSVVIVDEAHERSVNTDVLIGLLSRVVKLRRTMSDVGESNVKPLKLIIMSATMRVADFTANNRLFPQPPPVVNVNARQYPVNIHFNRKTALNNYVDEAFKKVAKIHQRLPPGGILVFLTGQDEIRLLCNKLRDRFPSKQRRASETDLQGPRVRCSARAMDLEAEDIEVEHDDELRNDDDSDPNAVSDDSDFEEAPQRPKLHDDQSEPLHVLPLFSLLPVNDQLRVFAPPPEGSRLCVVATNVAETSLTIPGIKYVVDCGRVKERVYERSTGIESFQIRWISKASAAQRAGRAGRTGPGHCYRLYSSAVFERDFPQFSEPEILKYPIEGIVLQMKSMQIEKVVNFPFPTPPERESLKAAEKLLEYLGALDKEHKVTPLGLSMSSFPLLPRYAKMIILGQQFGNMPYLIAIVAGLSVGDPFLALSEVEGSSKGDDGEEEASEKILSEEIRLRRKAFHESRAQFSALEPGCDVLKLLCAIGAYEGAGASDAFCEEKFLRIKTMKEIRKLRIQITSIINNQLSGIVAPVGFTSHLEPPTALQIRTIKQVVTAAYIDHLAIRSDLLDPTTTQLKAKETLRTPYSTLTCQVPSDENWEVFIHPNSAMASLASPPSYVVYSDIRESQQTGRLRLVPLTPVLANDIEPLARGTSLIQYSKPLNYPPPRVFTQDGVMQREVHVHPRFGLHCKGWQLPQIKRVERMARG